MLDDKLRKALTILARTTIDALDSGKHLAVRLAYVENVGCLKSNSR